MLDVALHSEEVPVPLADISIRQGISLSYLEQLFLRLRQAGLVVSTRGPAGGYQLGVDGRKIAIRSVLLAVDGSLDVTKCSGKGDCQNGLLCLTHVFWLNLNSRINGFLDSITIGELMTNNEVLKISERQNVDLIANRNFSGSSI
ncbi:HTH-type transcriptional regulator [Candidatus Photodesmus blepharus]|uniref:HTH-type transcriptional regulator n=2 Tax=Candidatus Photodesmus blepharonis TaxID=1179155 RepID=A0A084CPG9_9GAMM|nr:HTH-type transcriptional regulator [Candidatus Photodesmus blepharus]